MNELTDERSDIPIIGMDNFRFDASVYNLVCMFTLP
jgi:hypothetical protein